ncbi:MAG TPA: GNAT family N-acetyltransferase [Agromyces sp.]|nr:GNAT family N-acetyltransferase [Agromyces sp.]
MSTERADAAASPLIRPYRVADRDGVAEVCLRTAASGGDATGVYSDDALMPEVFALPYVEFAPELAFVVIAPSIPTGTAVASLRDAQEPAGVGPGSEPGGAGDRVLGYVIGVADTRDFVKWWKREWSPGFRARHPAPGPPTGHHPGFTEQQLLAAGNDPERMLIAEVDAYPAHLHIDLLPELQGRGFGRRLIDTLRTALAERGVPAVHLGMDAANIGARAFYDRLGFHELPSSTPDAPLLGIATH